MSKVAWKLKKKDFILFDVSTCSKLALIIEKNATNLFKQLLINGELIEKCFGGDLNGVLYCGGGSFSKCILLWNTIKYFWYQHIK